MTAPATLLIPLAGLLGEAPGSVRNLTIESDSIEITGDLDLSAPVRAELEIARTNRGLFVDGSVRASLVTECARCLGPAEVSIVARIREEVLPSVDPASGRAVDPSIEPDVARLTDHHELDAEPLIRDAITLSAPIAPLCKPGCPGLCITCGERLGDGHHAHEDDDVDPRLAALRAFRVDGSSKTE